MTEQAEDMELSEDMESVDICLESPFDGGGAPLAAVAAAEEEEEWPD